MGLMLVLKNELIRIAPGDPKIIEYSINKGRSWSLRYKGFSGTGEFKDLEILEDELLAITSKGVFYSRDNGRNWFFRGK